MKKQFNIIYVLVSVLFLLAACTNLRDLKPEEFKTQEFFVGEKKVNRSVAEIANAFSLNGIHTDGVKQNARINIKPGNKEAGG
jgi:outer membrane biogenesis lipoprotein LolB